MFFMKAHRPAPEKSVPRKHRKQLWCVLLASLPLWVLFVYFNYSAFLRENYVLVEDSVDLGEPVSVHVPGNYNENASVLHVEGEPVSEAKRGPEKYVEQEKVPLGNEAIGDVEQHDVVSARKEDEHIKPIVGAEDKPEKQSEGDSCSGRYIYIQNPPARFNDDIVKDCKSISAWTDMCRYISNMGLGPKVANSEKVFANTGWFATNQFSLELIFHNRMKQYRCLTNDSAQASAVYVPFYAGFDVSRYLWGGFNASTRDSASHDLVKWLAAQPEWNKMWGRDHFIVAGRITWDFRRMTEKDSEWGNNFLFLPQSKNATTLVIESSPWDDNDFAIPYPTYFHPSSDSEVFDWQSRMRKQRRRYLFSFAGAPRPNMEDSIRNQIIEQCQGAKRKCKLLGCSSGSNKCQSPVRLMKMFQSSVFCLQPSGDSFTRRSAFDSILAGCIPVFFHPGSAYVQYMWHFPKNYKKYSVFIPENEIKEKRANIERILRQIPIEKVAAMREEVIRMIPRIIYADPRFRLETLEDAFDVAIEGVLERVEKQRRNLSVGFFERNSWKYNLGGVVGEHEWDHFFSKAYRGNS